MPHSNFLSVSQLAKRWHQSAQEILELGLRRTFDIWFPFAGLVFKEGDKWWPAGNDTPDKAEIQRLRDFIRCSEQTLRQARVGEHEASTDGYLLAGSDDGSFGKRSDALGKRFGKLKDKLGFGPQRVFHSIRKTVVSQTEQAGVSENSAADIVGHDKPRITYGLYSARG